MHSIIVTIPRRDFLKDIGMAISGAYLVGSLNGCPPQGEGIISERMLFRDGSNSSRPTPVTVTYKENLGPGSPLAVFHHGYGGGAHANNDQLRNLVERGYVVAAPTHEGDIVNAGGTFRPIATNLLGVFRDLNNLSENLSEILQEDIGPIEAYTRIVMGAIRGEIQDERVLREVNNMFSYRAEDLVTVVRGMESLNQTHPNLKGLIDTGNIGVIGHSLGGNGAKIAGGGVDELWKRFYADEFEGRIKAVVAEAPADPLLTSPELMRVPTMTMVGEADENVSPEYSRQMFSDYGMEGDCFMEIGGGATHYSFTELGRDALDLISKDTSPEKRQEILEEKGLLDILLGLGNGPTPEEARQISQVTLDCPADFLDWKIRGDRAAGERVKEAGSIYPILKECMVNC